MSEDQAHESHQHYRLAFAILLLGTRVIDRELSPIDKLELEIDYELRLATMGGKCVPEGGVLGAAMRVVTGRWFIIAVCIMVNTASAGAYSWSVYSQKLKTVLNIDQETLNVVAAFKDLGVNLGIFAGLLFDYWSPAGVLLIGAAMTVTGYLCAWLAVTRRIGPSVWQMCLFLFIGNNSQPMLNTVVIVQSVKLFPANTGVTISLLKGYIGISGAILIQVYQAIEGSKNPEAFLLLMVWLPAAVALLSVPVISRTLTPFRGRPEEKYFYWFLALGFGLAFYLMGVRVAQNLTNVSLVGERVIGVVLLILLVVPCLIVTYAAEIYGKRSADEEEEIGGGGSGHGVLPDVESADGKPEGKEGQLIANKDGVLEPQFAKDSEKLGATAASEVGLTHHDHPGAHAIAAAEKQQPVGDYDDDGVGKKVDPRRGEDHTILQACGSLDLWLLFIAVIFGIGAGLTASDNMGQLGLSLGYNTTKVNTFVSLLSIWNAIGRWVGGFLSEMLLQKYAFPRTQFHTVSLLVMSFAFLLIAVNVPGCLYYGSILLGLSFGTQYSVTTTIVADVYGLKFFATLYNVLGIATIGGYYMLSVPVAGRFYDNEAKRQMGSKYTGGTTSLVCHGAVCFRRTFFILMGVTIGAAMFAAILWYRTRNLYKRIRADYQQSKIDECAKASQ